MNKKIFFIIILFLAAGIALHAESVFSGNMSSVDPHSGFNALRSPALMSFRTRDDISIGYIYSYLVDSDSDIDAESGGVVFDASNKTDEKYNGAFILSSVYHTGKHSWGIGITKGGDGQIVLSSNKITLENQALLTEYISDEETKVFSASFLLSYSYRLGNRSSVGLQIETQGSEIIKETDSKSYTGGALVEHTVVDSDQMSVTSGVIAGFFYTGGLLEFGAGIKSGRYGFENIEYRYDDKFNGVKNDESISTHFINDEGAGVVTGINIKPSYNLSFAFEAVAGVPYTHEEKRCNEEIYTLDEVSTDVTLDYAFQLKGGVTYKLGRRTTLGAGGSVLKYKSESEDEFDTAEAHMDFTVYQATAGADIKLSYDLSIMFGVNYHLVKGVLEQESPAISMKVRPESHTVDFVTGLSMFY
ncbi:MAG TPA: hypothetical protein PK358_01310 [Spirochaetota bacterium]|nr:hypothetical protein [Spirochaetota bacterium]HPJ33439.1 hypothetical protein [Spirochaetota bacterium]